MQATTQIYLEITSVGGASLFGETLAGGYETRIDIDSFDFGAKLKDQTLRDVDGKKARANFDFDTVTLRKVFDRATLPIASMLNAKERRLQQVRISVDQQYIDPDWDGKIRNEILIIEFDGAYVAKLDLRTSESNLGAQIQESLTISFHKFRVIYYAEDRNRKGLIRDDYRTEVHMYESPVREQGEPAA